MTMVYHIFEYWICGKWYRDSFTYSDQQFARIMDKLAWKLPYNIQVFHYGIPGPDPYTLNDRVLLERPVLSLDIEALVGAKPETRIMLRDKLQQKEYPVLGQVGRFVLAGGGQDDSWPRLYYADGSTVQLRAELRVVPLSFHEARDYVAKYHRHNTAPQGHKFSIGLITPSEQQYIGVAIASIPKARMQDDGYTLEINRVCCDPCYANACSKLYSAIVQSGRAMGYRRFISYTLPEESGSSMRAVGFKLDGCVPASPRSWDTPRRPRIVQPRYPTGQKLRWVLTIP